MTLRQELESLRCFGHCPASSFLLLFSWFQRLRSQWGKQSICKSLHWEMILGHSRRTASCQPFPEPCRPPHPTHPTLGSHQLGPDPESSCKFCPAHGLTTLRERRRLRKPRPPPGRELDEIPCLDVPAHSCPHPTEPA